MNGLSCKKNTLGVYRLAHDTSKLTNDSFPDPRDSPFSSNHPEISTTINVNNIH